MSAPRRVLILTDDVGTWSAIEDLLGAQGHGVELTSGAAGVACLGSERVDAVIVDLALSEVIHRDIWRATASSPWRPAVLFVSEAASLNTLIQVTCGVGFAYLVKPFEVGHVLATLDRVLERHGRIRELRDSEGADTERHVRLQNTALEAAANGIVITDRGGAIVWVNRAFTRLTGYSAEEALGQTPRILKSGRHEPTFFVHLWETICAGQVWRGETINRRRDGSLYTENQTITPVRGQGGEITHFIAIKQDITREKQLQAELARSEKQAAMGRLLAGVAHLLNNPLAVVVGHAALLREEAGTGTTARRADRIAAAADRCASLLRDFLALAGERSREQQPVALNQVVQEALDTLAAEFRADDVEVVVRLAGDLPALWADSRQLCQAVVSLLGNAHQAMCQTAPPRRLSLVTRLDPVRGHVILEVSDTGPGMPPEAQAQLFEPFLVPGPRGHGTELGLALCQAIVEEHGGRIWADSPSGDGAVVRVELPVVSPPATENARTTRPGFGSEASSILPKEFP